MEREVAILFLAVLIGLAYQLWDLEKRNQSLELRTKLELRVMKDKIIPLESLDLEKKNQRLQEELKVLKDKIISLESLDLGKKNQRLQEELKVLKDKIISLESLVLGFKDNPAFFVTLEQHPFTLYGIDDVVKFDGIKVNIGGGYSSHTGYFVCPKPGVYHISALILGNHGHVVHYQLNVNDDAYVIGYSKKGVADSSTVSVVAKLNVGDRVFIKHRSRIAEEQIAGTGHSSFSGFFVHE